ncbi:polysaccharide biosynthesis C-terminal domain-containing protein [Nonomuraea sp. NPDC050691]|uniref:lipopolysaccharide biosynthesis protein n=1 Tax=Nonomuraea sp. NPDC050691 TaxID=3155661 RepID=UPI0033CDE434
MTSSAALALRTLATRGVRLGLETVTGVIIARTLQPEGRGVYAVISTAAFAAIVVGHLSLEKSQITLWEDRSRHQPLATNGLILGLILGSLSALGALGIVALSGSPGGLVLWVLALAVVPLGAASVNLNGIMTLQSRMDVVNRKSLLAALARCLPILALAILGHLTLTGVIVCWALSIALPFVLVVGGIRPISLRVDRALVRRQLGLSGRYHVGWVALYLIVTIDVPLLSALDSPAAVGIYTVAVTVMTLTRIPCETITQIALPKQASRDVDEAKHVTVRALRLILLVSSAFVVVLVAASPWMIPLVYGESFAGSVAPLLALAPGTVALMLIRAVEQHLVRLERPLTMTAVSVGVLCANVLLNLVMIPRWGAVGAALASTVTYIAMAVLEISRFARLTGLPVRALVPGRAEVHSVVKPLMAVASGNSRHASRHPASHRPDSYSE